MKNKVFSVTQINTYIKRMFQSDYALRRISIKGQVSNCKYHSSGHIYFSLKDEGSQISCVMFANARYDGLKFELEDGQEVVVDGNISVYERGGSYQLYAQEIRLNGIGELYVAYEMLKQKLYEEGLFDHEKKKPIPKNPKKIGVVTARTGAAIHDIISTAKRRNPYVQLILYPAKVQGDGASDTIVAGIKALDQYGVDIIIVGRGGGSIEDLWAFNEEKVARAIYEAQTPIISGTGHEVDTTIADYAADLRAATPTAACELAVPDIREVMEGIINREYTLRTLLKQVVRRYQMKLQQYQITIANFDPRFQLQEQKMHLAELEEQIHAVMKNKMTDYQHKLELYTKELHGLSPTAKLINGFGYIEGSNGEPVTSVKKVMEGDQISLTISDGTIITKAEQIKRMDEIKES
ncbi:MULTISPECIES: exodeoxyribonuclease VII large subunit [Anaerostipes]|jgi:exodeoxyribonuclease VII large subunit|uniref:exodeoxyribonuclease VII large subunit n=1 Tax=Anaerostipes TaxID=207244 RepID=UPI0006C106E6|nr:MULTISPECIES: exodeoxyribonuclease VII large subunit [Anaerostipes]MBT9903966.1 exodeoxyribonuclease VII large subunit [Anaerostipes hadrus]MCU6781206.1 exodeoxyribonuclease VII large subunit [Anaerostipes amylophilus]CUN92338.1 Exodeoxyribonuclease 7 large subunit [Anaerostipes hadrus]